MADPLAALRDGLQVADEALAVLAGLSAAEQARFAATVESAVAADTRRVEDALEATLKLVPAPLRVRARSMLFPKDQA